MHSKSLHLLSHTGAHTLICGSGDVNDVGDVGCQLGKKGDGGGLSDPATDVPHQFRVLE